MKVKLLKKSRSIYTIYLEKNSKGELMYCLRDKSQINDYSRQYYLIGIFKTKKEAIEKMREKIISYAMTYYKPKKII